jgi:hypothetical protein
MPKIAPNEPATKHRPLPHHGQTRRRRYGVVYRATDTKLNRDVAVKVLPDSFASRVGRKNIECCWVDAGDKNAGRICVLKRASGEKEATLYRMYINRNHKPPVQFTTLAHELGHLFLGHLGEGKKLNVPGRWDAHNDQREIEAESVAYIVCRRNGVTPASETYLASYVGDNMTGDDIDVFQVMRAAGQVEAVLGLAEHSKFEKPNGDQRRSAHRARA